MEREKDTLYLEKESYSVFKKIEITPNHFTLL